MNVLCCAEGKPLRHCFRAVNAETEAGDTKKSGALQRRLFYQLFYQFN